MSRVSRAVFAVVMVAGCGGVAPPAPMAVPAPVALAPTPAGDPGGPVAVAPVTCADAGVLLARTYTTYDEKMTAQHETEIAKACTAGAWSQAVLDCIGSTITDGAKCVAQLTHEQQVALAGSVTAAKPPEPPPDPDAEDNKYTPCELAIAAPEAFGPQPEGSADDVAFATALRKHRLVDTCSQDNWGEHAKECFQNASDVDHVMTCIRKLPDHQQSAEEAAIIGALDLASKTFEVRKKAASITCAKVVAVHYADATWTDKLTMVKPAQKKAAITASRAKMTKTCTADKWSPTLRACQISGGDFPECSMLASGVDPWGFPAFGVMVPTGVPACDKYLAGLAKLAECPGAKDMRDALYAMISSAQGSISSGGDDNRKVFAEACSQGTDALVEEFKTLGCKP